MLTTIRLGFAAREPFIRALARFLLGSFMAALWWFGLQPAGYDDPSFLALLLGGAGALLHARFLQVRDAALVQIGGLGGVLALLAGALMPALRPGLGYAVALPAALLILMGLARGSGGPEAAQPRPRDEAEDE